MYAKFEQNRFINTQAMDQKLSVDGQAPEGIILYPVTMVCKLLHIHAFY